MPENYLRIKKTLEDYPANLVAVSKTRSQESILKLYEVGQRAFGENRVQELIQKQKELPKDINWHLIGSLQRNKVRQIASFIHLIHSVDSLKLLETINTQAKKYDRVIDCLLQFKVSVEASKHGLNLETAEELLTSKNYEAMKNIRLCGVMGMASFSNDQEKVKKEFQETKEIFDFLKENHFKEQNSFKEISMGMSGDYELALKEGSTIIRIGSLLFR